MSDINFNLDLQPYFEELLIFAIVLTIIFLSIVFWRKLSGSTGKTALRVSTEKFFMSLIFPALLVILALFVSLFAVFLSEIAAEILITILLGVIIGIVIYLPVVSAFDLVYSFHDKALADWQKRLRLYLQCLFIWLPILFIIVRWSLTRT